MPPLPSMPSTPEAAAETLPQPESLVAVRGQKWVVSSVEPAPLLGGGTVVTLQSVEHGRYGDTLDVIWEIEPGRWILPSGSLPDVSPDHFDPPERLAAFLDSVRWSTITSADVRTLQAPFRSGVAIEDYQLEPVARAVAAPRVNLLLADDVGLGKTVEAGLVAQELLLRHRSQRIMIVCPAGLTVKWQDEMFEKFGLDFTIIDSGRCAQVRRDLGSSANPFKVYPLTIVSLPWLRGAKAQRLLDEVLPAGNDGAAPPTSARSTCSSWTRRITSPPPRPSRSTPWTPSRPSWSAACRRTSRTGCSRPGQPRRPRPGDRAGTAGGDRRGVAGTGADDLLRAPARPHP
ncbi:SNF2-related protein [Streptomonospora litoralis]|uniref:RNA polymerase-associated protein RapA n=1 Tax=Streptomonospora litoralis TaxID=2498135 RepID=A0A4P6Q4B2_9ACTN|nr:SNF2-related protein [Streptomonospora litoralis]QBI53664.1 RNA polymerase-associated protein RapA [Streptomonospora litoralis]